MQVAELLVDILVVECPDAFAIWYVDTASGHLGPDAWDYLFRSGISLCFVPTKATWLLQHLYAFIFRKFKQ